MDERIVSSPDGRRRCTLFLQGEIRGGPTWYGCALEDGVVAARVFGQEALWSDDGRYLALSEWLTTDERAGPDTRLFVADLAERRVYTCARLRGGFVEPARFEGDLLVYRRVRLDEDTDEEGELDVVRIASWEPLEVLG